MTAARMPTGRAGPGRVMPTYLGMPAFPDAARAARGRLPAPP